MGFLAGLLGREPSGWNDHRRVSRLQAATRERTRRELISVAVRDALKIHDLPADCITADCLPSLTPTKERGLHIQLVFRDCRPRLLAYVVTLESAVKRRLRRLDPLSPSWITAVSWRFEPTNRTVSPEQPGPGESSASVAPAADDGRARAALALERLIQSGDEAFMSTVRGELVTATAFSPTLPMRAQPQGHVSGAQTSIATAD